MKDHFQRVRAIMGSISERINLLGAALDKMAQDEYEQPASNTAEKAWQDGMDALKSKWTDAAKRSDEEVRFDAVSRREIEPVASLAETRRHAALHIAQERFHFSTMQELIEAACKIENYLRDGQPITKVDAVPETVSERIAQIYRSMNAHDRVAVVEILRIGIHHSIPTVGDLFDLIGKVVFGGKETRPGKP